MNEKAHNSHIRKKGKQMSENDWLVQDTVQGIDDGGRQRMLNIRGVSLEDFQKNIKALEPHFKGWKALPIKSFGGGGGKPADPPKEIKTWADIPKCAVHGSILYPKAWQGHEGKFWWNCGEKTDGEWCRAKHGMATQEQFDAYSKLDPDDKPTGKKEEGGLSSDQLLATLANLRKELKTYLPDTPNLKQNEVDTEAKIYALLAVTQKQLKQAKAAA